MLIFRCIVLFAPEAVEGEGSLGGNETHFLISSLKKTYMGT